MTDLAADIVVETHRGVEIRQRPYDPYGGPKEYYYIYGGGHGRSPIYSDLDTLKKNLDFEIDTAPAGAAKK